MKLRVLLVFAAVQFSLNAEHISIHLARPQFESIQKAQKAVDSLLKWHTMYQIATVATLVTGVGAVGYGVYKVMNAPDTGTVGAPLEQIELRKIYEELSAFLNHYNSKHVVHRNWIMGQLHWLKKMVLQNVNSVLVGVGATMIFNAINNSFGPISKYIARMDGFLDRTISEVFHKNNLEWFIHHQANLIGITTVLKQYASMIEGRQIDALQSPLHEGNVTIAVGNDAQRYQALQDFVTYWMLFIEQLESVLGFMQYKGLKNLNPTTRECMIDVSTKIQGMVDEFAKNCEEKNTASETGLIALYDDFIALTSKIGFEFSNFSLLDSYKRIDIMPVANNN